MNAVDTDGGTPLFLSIIFECLECAKVLLAAGATVNHRNGDGRTPLDSALAQPDGSAARAKMVEVLEAAGGLRAVDLPDDDSDDENA